MPTYEVTQDSTGITLQLEGDRPPTESDVNAAFAAYGKAKAPQSPEISERPSLLNQVGQEIKKTITGKLLDPTGALHLIAMSPEGRDMIRNTAGEKVAGVVSPSTVEPQLEKPAGSVIDREGVMGLLSASPEKREAFKEAGEAIGGLVGPKTAAAGGVIGEAAANLLSPMSVMTLGVGGELKALASVPKTLRAINEAATASDLLAAANTARVAQGLERTAVTGFGLSTAKENVPAISQVYEAFKSDTATPEDKVRAGTALGVNLLFSGLLGKAGKEVFKNTSQAQVMEALASKKISDRNAIERLRQIRDEIDVLEAGLPKEKTVPMTPDEVRVEAEAKNQIQTTKDLMDKALMEAAFPKKIITGEPTALEQLKRQDLGPLESVIQTPEKIGEGPRQAVEGQLPEKALTTVDEILSERARLREVERAGEPPAPEPTQPTQAEAAPAETPAPTLLETVADKLKRSLEQRDRVNAAQAIADALESGKAQGEPAVVTRKMVESQLGLNRKTETPTISKALFDEIWDAELQRQGVGRFEQGADALSKKLEGLRVDVAPGVGSLPIVQILGQSWNGAIVVAQSMLKGGAKLADAIEKAVKYVRQDFNGKFDEAQLRQALQSHFGAGTPIVASTGQKPRTFAQRAATSAEVPPVIQQKIATSPEAVYTPQVVKEVVDKASRATEAELTNDLADTGSNTRVASGIELFNRRLAEGNSDAASQMAINLAKMGTTWGQLINQFKLLKSSTPEGLVSLVSTSLKKQGRGSLSPELASKLKTEMEQFNQKKTAVDEIDQKLKTAVEADASQSDLDSLYRQKADIVAEFNQANTKINEALSKANPATAADTFLASVQGAVMGPLSIIRNIIGNSINIPARELGDVSAKVIDSLVTGGKNNSYDLNARTLVRLKAFGETLPQAVKVILKGSDVMPYEIGKDIGNPLNFQRGWKNLFDALSHPEDRTVGNIVRSGYEATLGAFPDIMLRLSQATDIPFRQAERARIIEEYGKTFGLNEKQIQLAKSNIDLLKITDAEKAAGKKGLTAEQIEQVEFEAARAVYQQDNEATKAIGNVNRWIQNRFGPGGYLPYRMLALFQKTPINILGEVLSFTPLAGLARNLKDMNPRERNILVGKQIVGTMAIGAFSQLYDKGIISPNLNTPAENEKARQLAQAGGVMPPGALNVTGLKRYVNGGDGSFRKGDEVIDLTSMGLAGALGLMVGTAKRVKEQSRNGENDLLAIGYGGLLGSLNFVMQQQFLKGTSDFIGLMNQDPKASFNNFAKGMLMTAGSPFAPNILASIDRADRQFLPVVKDETAVKSALNEFGRRLNVLGISIPGAADPNKLPLKRNLWGEAVPQTPEGKNPWTYNFLDAIRMRPIQDDPLNADVYRLWRKTSDDRAIPSIPNPAIEFNKVDYEKMNPQQYDRYSQLVGFYRRTLAERIYMSGGFANASDDQKIDALSKAYSMGARMGKYKFMEELKNSGQSLTPVGKKKGFTQE